MNLSAIFDQESLELLAARAGGRRCYVPVDPATAAGKWPWAGCSNDALERLCAEAGGESVAVPTAGYVARIAAKRRAREMFRARSSSIQEVVAATGLSRRTVQRLRLRENSTGGRGQAR